MQIFCCAMNQSLKFLAMFHQYDCGFIFEDFIKWSQWWSIDQLYIDYHKFKQEVLPGIAHKDRWHWNTKYNWGGYAPGCLSPALGALNSDLSEFLVLTSPWKCNIVKYYEIGWVIGWKMLKHEWERKTRFEWSAICTYERFIPKNWWFHWVIEMCNRCLLFDL